MSQLNVTHEMTNEYVRWSRRAKGPFEHLFYRATSGERLSEEERVCLFTFLLINGAEGHDPDLYGNMLEILRTPVIVSG